MSPISLCYPYLIDSKYVAFAGQADWNTHRRNAAYVQSAVAVIGARSACCSAWRVLESFSNAAVSSSFMQALHAQRKSRAQTLNKDKLLPSRYTYR
jgi:hypothetical protein